MLDTSAVEALIETCSLGAALRSFGKNHQLTITERVLEEYQSGHRLTIDVNAVKRTFSEAAVIVSEELLPYFHFDPSSGEISVISYVIQTPDACCVIDEEFARNVCKIFGVDFTGTVGMLKRMLKEGALERASLRRIREKLRRSRFYLTAQLLNELR